MLETIEQIRSKAIDFDVDINWAIHRKREYVHTRLRDIQDRKKELTTFLLKRSPNKVERETIFLALKDIEKWEKDLNVYVESLNRQRNKLKISDDMIRQAKEYPIEKLVEVNRNKAKCIKHDDTNPSMDCRNNFAHCYVCGETWDTIDIVMITKHMDFGEAVRRLCDG